MKQIKFNLLAIIGLMVAVGTVAFTGRTTLALQWYEVTPHATNSELDEIGALTSNPTQGGDCETTKIKNRCAIQLDLSNASIMPETVEEARTTPGVVVGSSTFKEN